MHIRNWDNTRLYKIDHSIEVKEQSQKKETKIHFDIGIRCSQKTENKRHIFIKENYRINSQEPEDHYLRLVCELEAAAYPLEIEVDSYGYFERIPVHSLWLEQWKTRAGEIVKNKYQGDFAQSLKDQIQGTLDTEEKLKQKLQQEAFWRLYFFDNTDPRKEKQFRWTIAKVGTLFFSGNVQVEKNQTELVSLYQGKTTEFDADFIEDINIMLNQKKGSKHYLSPEQLHARCTVESRWEAGSGKLLQKNTEIILNTANNSYIYSEKLEIKHHSISIRKTPAASTSTLFISEED